jgi:hypothetical protein
MNQPVPLRPDFNEAMRLERRSWHRALACHALARVRHDDPNRIRKSAWPADERAALILKAAQNPTSTASFPAHDAVAAFRSLAPGSAAVALFDLGLKLDLRGVTTVSIPNVAAFPAAPIFVEEGKPGPSVQWPFGKAVVGPVRKLLVLSAVSGELNDATPDTAAAVIGRVLADASNKSLDAAAFGSAAADAVQPAGLLHGVTPLAAAAAGSDAMAEDLASLVGAIGNAGIDPTGAVYVAAPREAQMIRLQAGPKFNNPVLMTLGLPAKTVAAFAPTAVASGYQDAPTIETAKESVIHFEDTNPADIGTPGSPAVVAAPSKSAFQTDIIAVRVRANCAWAVASGGAHVVANVNW